MEEWNSACLSSCSRSDRPLVELCVEPAVFSRQCTAVSVPLRDVLSSTGLPSKWCAGIGFFSRADQEIGVFWNAAPHTRLRLEFPRETGLMLRCPWKVGKAFQTKQVNRPYCRDQEGRRGSDEVVSGPSVFPSREPGVSGNFWGSHERCQVLFRTSGRKLGLPLRRHSGQEAHLAKTLEPRGFP